MTLPEFNAWIAYYRLHPFDDRHRIHRPAALLAHVMGGADMDDLIDALEPRPAPDDGYSDADRATLAAFRGMR